MKKIKYMDTSFRDGFQSCLGARVKTEDFMPALEAAVEAGTTHFEIGGGARFQSLYFYCQQDAFEMMRKAREIVGPNVNLQTLARGTNVVGLISQCREIIDLHAKLFKKHGITTIRNFDALNDVRNLDYSGRCIHNAGLKHQAVVAMMGLPPGVADTYEHTPKFYTDRLKDIIEAGIPFDSVCFKDASGTSTPNTVFETIKGARAILGKDVEIQFHTHCTAGCAVSCHMAAIEAGADVIDLAMAPVSGGTSHPDILTMWHQLKGTKYTLDIDFEKMLKAEEVFQECMEKYFMPPEAKEVNPLITLSPMPGGALTANTQMMRDNNCLHLFPKVIKAMREVVERGGFGTSVTPVSQFYFQQAFANVTQGPWKKMTEGYGKMVLGYFGKTPSKPDAEIIKIASEQLGLEPTTEAPVDINDKNPELGIAPAKKILSDNNLELSDENIFIISTCGDKGLGYLKGNATLGIRYKEAETKSNTPATTPAPAKPSYGPAAYNVTVNGKTYHVDVAPSEGGKAPAVQSIHEIEPSSTSEGKEITAPMPGSIQKILVIEGDNVSEDQTIFIIEAMKMEVEIKAPASGKVKSINVKVGDTVNTGQVVAII